MGEEPEIDAAEKRRRRYERHLCRAAEAAAEITTLLAKRDYVAAEQPLRRLCRHWRPLRKMQRKHPEWPATLIWLPSFLAMVAP